MNNVPGPFGGMGHIILASPPYNHPHPVERQDEPPVRVQVAIKLLEHFTQKTQEVVAIGPMSTETVPGQKLTNDEVNVRSTACSLLTDYLQGRMNLNRWEKAEFEKKKKDQNFKTVMDCPLCRQAGTVRPQCELCNGAGRVSVCPEE